MRKLESAEINAVLDSRPDVGPLSAAETAAIRHFLINDDGKPFYMVNLMKLREHADYPDGLFPEVKTGKQADDRYGRIILPQLLKRGSYPIFLSQKQTNLLRTDEGTDFFERVGIVRYRSRRDFLNMIASPKFQQGEIHKWASMESTTVVPMRRILHLNLSIIVPAVLLLIANIWHD